MPVEIEEALRKHPDVARAAVFERHPGGGDARLTAYVVARAGRRVSAAELRAFLMGGMPEDAVPTVFGFLEELPLQADGAVDRGRLELIEPAGAPAPNDQPAGELELTLAGIWAEALERRRVGRDEEFLALGGDRRAAEGIAERVRESFGVGLHARDLARTPTIASMAERLERVGGHSCLEGPAIARVARAGPVPCSFAQERIWPTSRDPETAIGYTIASDNRLRGPLSVAALRLALEDVVRAHEILRTTFVERDGVPLQVIRQHEPMDIPLINLGGDAPAARAREMLLRLADEPFDLERGPMIRMQVVRIADDDHHLLRSSHHLLSDRGAWQVFFRDLAWAYQARLHGGPPFSLDGRPGFADFARWERDRLGPGTQLARQEAEWWMRVLERERPVQPLPFERAEPEPEAAAEDGWVIDWLDLDESRALDRAGRSVGASYYASRLAVFMALFGLETDCEEVQIGTYASNRRTPEAQSMIGFFSNVITLIAPFDRRLSFQSWLARVMMTLADAGARRQVPYERICAELRESGSEPPEIRALFQIYERWEVDFGDVEAEPPDYWFPGVPWGFTFVVDPRRDRDRCVARFDPRIYDPAAVRLFVDRFRRLAARVAAEPERPLGELLLA